MPAKSERQTKQKELIMRAVLEHGGHPTAEEIYNKLKDDYPRLSLATVYRNLNLFTTQGKLSSVVIPGEPLHFDYISHPHAHLICRKCGHIVDVPAYELLEELKDSDYLPEAYRDFTIERVQLHFEGICKDCRMLEEQEARAEEDQAAAANY